MRVLCLFKQKTAYEIEYGLVGSEMCIRDRGWKVNPFIIIKPGETFTLAEIDGPGAIQHIWMTPVSYTHLTLPTSDLV